MNKCVFTVMLSVSDSKFNMKIYFLYGVNADFR